MVVNGSREIEGPILVDEDFIRGTSRALNQTIETLIPLIAKEFSIAKDSLVLSKTKRRSGSSQTSSDLANHCRLSYLTPTFSVTFESGLSLQTSSVDEIIFSLENEPSCPKSFECAAGKFDVLHTKISAGAWTFRSARFDVRGERTLVVPIREELERVFLNSEPPHRYMYGKASGRILVLALCVYFIFLYLFMVSKFNAKLHPDLVKALIAGTGFALVPIFIVSLVIMEKMRKVFPDLQFKFGLNLRRRNSKFSFIKYLIATLIAPILLIPIGAIFN